MSKRISKRSPRKRTLPAYAKLHKLIVENDAVRKKLYAKLGRVRCYLYKTGRTTPSPATAKTLEKITGIRASSW